MSAITQAGGGGGVGDFGSQSLGLLTGEPTGLARGFG